LRNKKGPEYQDLVKNSQTIILHKEIKESSEQPKYINWRSSNNMF